MEIVALKPYFEGKWNLERKIYTKSNHDLQATAAGQACFRAEGTNRLIYNEEGRISLLEQHKSFPFFRRFRYDMEEAVLDLYFADGPNTGALYQRYHFDESGRTLIAEKKHVCITDHYDGVYRLIDDHHFEWKTTVEGERKDLLMLTRFVRC